MDGEGAFGRPSRLGAIMRCAIYVRVSTLDQQVDNLRDVLCRELYRGRIVWNKSKKRDRWGKVKQTKNPEAMWITKPAPELRIIPDAVWNAAHKRLQEARASYLRATGGRLHGHPLNAVAAKYLLTGLSKCGLCGGSLEVVSRPHGKRRAKFYACSNHNRRGESAAEAAPRPAGVHA
jgi:Recombinase/Recombinase zinc beta ribbon domain